ncbi:MAG: AAA family ATPase [Proteobacteria bacterium]|nr:AAA family ATPase [Pseudomonadota bacterium]
MGRFLNPGNGGFQRIIDAEVYVDKTGILGFLNKWINTDARYVCVSRARRFGKTVAARTIRAYYDNSCDSHELFAPYAIAQEPSYETHINTYDVIGIDVQSFFLRGDDPKTFIDRMELDVLAEVCAKWPDIAELKNMRLVNALIKVHEKTGARFVFVIDEWDAVFRFCPNDEALQKDWIHFLRDLFKQEDMDGVIALAYITGILPVKKYKT